MTGSFDSQALVQEPRQAPPVGRALRILLALALTAQVVPVYLREGLPLAIRALLLVVGVIGVYSLVPVLASRRIVAFGPGLGSVQGLVPLVALYVAGGTGAPLLGRGAGQLAAVTYLALSLVVAGVRADPGCEVMAIPGVLFGKHTELACLIFSPLDRLERKWRSKRVL